MILYILKYVLLSHFKYSFLICMTAILETIISIKSQSFLKIAIDSKSIPITILLSLLTIIEVVVREIKWNIAFKVAYKTEDHFRKITLKKHLDSDFDKLYSIPTQEVRNLIDRANSAWFIIRVVLAQSFLTSVLKLFSALYILNFPYLVFGSIFIIYVLAMQYTSNLIESGWEKVYDYRNQSNLLLSDILDCGVIVKSYNKTQEEVNEYASSNEKHHSTEAQTKIYIRYQRIFHSLIESLFRLYILYEYFSKTHMTVTDIMINLNIQQMIMNPLDQLSRINYQIKKYSIKFSKLESYLSKTVQKKCLNISKLKHHIRLDDVSFGYDIGYKVLFKNVNLTVEKGELIGIVGQNGVGKSTLTKILCGQYKPTTGIVLWDDIKLDGFPHNQVKIIYQQSKLFNRPFLDNVFYQSLYQDANFTYPLKEWFDKLKDKTHTYTASFSGGETKKTCILRAFCSKDKPSLIIYDEILNNLDSQSCKDIIQFIKSLKGNVTQIVITHRPDLLNCVDALFKIENNTVSRI